ncbi:reverse transcriptase-like protein [Parasponia andersonii]|uniref:Reverse transcriptase-like protein n=1 Tax=Parasponia andersonii TaxID=3476 RepID=A0A2P5ACS3_PARAD|nr:reverse transcriptase-like protein [Parasponia andersonii]
MENAAMEMEMEIFPSSSGPLHLRTIRSRVRELENMLRDLEDDVSDSDSDSEKLLQDYSLNFQNRMEEIGSEWSDVGFLTDKDFDECLKRLGEELYSVVAESTKISQEIEVLETTHAEDYNRLEIEFEGLKCSLDYAALQDLEKAKLGASEDHSNSMNVYGSNKLQLLELENQIKKKSIILKSLEDLDYLRKWFDAIEQIEDAFTGVKVIAFDENCIRLSLQTFIPKLERILSQQKIEAINVPEEVKHELMIEVFEGSMDQKNVEIFPSDVYINDIVNAAKNFGYSLEYLDKDEIILAHLAGGVDALIKASQGWPQSSSPLQLISLKSSDNDSKGISLSFLCKVKEVVNLLAANIRQNLSSFVDAVEKILVKQMQLQLQDDENPKNDQ